MSEAFKSMKEIGATINLSSHQVGKRLKKLGYRTQEGKPSQKAFEEGLCQPRWSQSGEKYLWVWRENKVIDLLLDEINKPKTDEEQIEPPAFQLW